MNRFVTNQTVKTPNGIGIIQGLSSGSMTATIYSNGDQLYIVRHKLSEMKSKDAGTCITPKCVQTGLWVYSAAVLEAVR